MYRTIFLSHSSVYCHLYISLSYIQVMSGIHSFSRRQNDYRLRFLPINKHKFVFPRQQLLTMFNNYPLFIEMGGLLSLSYALRTNLIDGLKFDEEFNNYKRRRNLYGSNKLPIKPIKPFFTFFKEAIECGMLKILILTGIISVITGSIKDPIDGWIEGTTILICVFIVSTVSAYNNYKQELEYRKLQSVFKENKVTALRNGQSISINAEDVLVGDIIYINPGDMISADGVISDMSVISVNESSITGESIEKYKSLSTINSTDRTPDPFLYSGTEVINGSCTMLVTSVGIHSTRGNLMQLLNSEAEQTNLQIRLTFVEKLAAYIGITCGIITFCILLIRFLVSNNNNNLNKMWNYIVDIFVLSITVVIVAVPEGLPLAVTISLAYSMNRMRSDQNLIKVLPACETMGSVTSLCSDKTGTLTKNKMVVRNIYIGQKLYTRIPYMYELSDYIHKLLVDSIVLNSNRYTDTKSIIKDIEPENWKWEGDGGATESALLSMVARYYYPFTEKYDSNNPNIKQEIIQDIEHFTTNIMQQRKVNHPRIVKYYPFSSIKKYSSVIIANTICELNNNNISNNNTINTTIHNTNINNIYDTRNINKDKIRNISNLPPYGIRYFKGAAEYIIERCSKLIDSNSNIIDISYIHNIDYTKKLLCKYRSNDDTICDRYATLALKKKDSINNDTINPICCGLQGHFLEGTTPDDYYLYENNPIIIMKNMTRIGLRCIALAYIDNIKLEVKDGNFIDPEEHDTSSQYFIGLIGIEDPLRDETKMAVAAIQKAGVILRMVTGDNLDTAIHIAKQCNIITSNKHIALEGPKFCELLQEYKSKDSNKNITETKDKKKFIEFIDNLRVIARCRPKDKLEIVNYLKEQGEIVGVTGDGSNDGPALRAATVGLSMGITGTDIAKAASDIIILDDNFSSIVKSVMWGRSIFDNIRKFLQFQCCVNLSALSIVFISSIIDGKEPLKPIQLLWVNLVMDTMGALAISTEKPTSLLQMRNPYKPDASIITTSMWCTIIIQIFFQLFILLIVLHMYEISPTIFIKLGFTYIKYNIIYVDELAHHTFIFNTFVWLQLFNELNCRRLDNDINIFKNISTAHLFICITVVACILQVQIIEEFGTFMQTKHQTYIQWFIAIQLGFTQLLTGACIKCILPYFIPENDGYIFRDNDPYEGATILNDPNLSTYLHNSYDLKKPIISSQTQYDIQYEHGCVFSYLYSTN